MSLEIRKWTGGKITEPGLYDMPMSVYHSDCCDGPSVSSTGLRTLLLKSPLHFWDRSYLNPDRDPDDPDEIEKEHFRIGRAAHWSMFERETFERAIAVRPTMWDSWRSKEAKAWRLDAMREGMTVMTPDEMERVHGVVRSLTRHPLYQQGLLGGAIETSIIARDSKTGIWIKARPDSVPIEEAFTDLKVVSDAKPDVFERTIRDIGYDLQLALGGICYEKVTKRAIEQFWIVAVESSRPHPVHVASLSTDAVYWARIRLRTALDRMAKCLETGYWPAYDEDGRSYKLHEQVQNRLKLEQDNQLLAPTDEF